MQSGQTAYTQPPNTHALTTLARQHSYLFFHTASPSHMHYLPTTQNSLILTITRTNSPSPNTPQTVETCFYSKGGGGGGKQNIRHTKCHTTPFTTLNRLSLLFPLNPSLTLTLPYVQSSNVANSAQSGTPALPRAKQQKEEGRASFFFHNQRKRRQNADLFVFLREQNTL